ncbi:hypothetical protein DdX_00334 [Ditylenchus destructor]|uniref:Uncharacterized protein n=1 Tax=Ditylenchus destructor TaxID=166010 RepID=A0AAD4NII6_9BILA|nr:hypothetical protein DdX_00334 [Ditylenchus destructor]
MIRHSSCLIESYKMTYHSPITKPSGEISRTAPAAPPLGGALGHPGFSGFPEAINPGIRRCSRQNRYQSTQLVETKRFMYHTPGTELRLVFCDLPKSRIFRISGSHKSRKSPICPAKAVPIDSARRDEAIHVSHARNRAATGFSGFPEAINPGNRRSARRNRYQSTQLVETKRFMYHTPGTELRLVFCDLPKSRIFRISGSHKSRKSPICPAKPVPIDSARRDEAIHISHARKRAATGVL